MNKNWLNFILFILVAFALWGAWFVYDIYETEFNNIFPTSKEERVKREAWGLIGDYFGGTLNTIFSFFGLIMLLITLAQNQKALIQNQRELELSRQELSESNQALSAQANTLEKQRFEDTFFALLDQLNRFLDRILSETIIYNRFEKPEKHDSPVNSLINKLMGPININNSVCDLRRNYFSSTDLCVTGIQLDGLLKP